jgi:hypothetical protein
MARHYPVIESMLVVWLHTNRHNMCALHRSLIWHLLAFGPFPVHHWLAPDFTFPIHICSAPAYFTDLFIKHCPTLLDSVETMDLGITDIHHDHLLSHRQFT